MDAHDSVVDLAAAAQPLPRGSSRLRAALERSRFVDATDGLRVRMLACDQPLAFVAHLSFFPLDRFHETL
jgi:hypothetical protein